MKLSDYVAQKVHELGIKHVFMVTGGGSMHLNHSLGTHVKLECIFNHHEQAATMAAESYCRLTNNLALVNVTSGPGGTNTITGVYGAYTDSIGMLVVSGQVKYETTTRSTKGSLRQLGDQEIDIGRIVSSITKYSVMVIDPKSIRYHLEKAFYLASSGRPGPCWVDIPLDIQSSEIDIDYLEGFIPDRDNLLDPVKVEQVSRDIIDKLQRSKRPVIFAGSGVRLSGQHENFIKLIDKLGVPVVTGWNAHDVIWNSHQYFLGRPGTVGDRAGNFMVQSSDLILVLGSRLNIRQVSYNWKSFAEKAYKIWVDVDPMELNKPTVSADMPVNANLKEIIPSLIKHSDNFNKNKFIWWVEWGQKRRKQYPVVLKEYWNSDKINPYCFMDDLFKKLSENQIIVTANGTACVVSFQAANIKKNQRLWTNSGCASMGYDLPASIGASVASNNGSVVCLAGDGSIMMNLQELQTIVHYCLPIKIFILNNSGYASISQTQKRFFNGVKVGSDADSGLSFPDFSKVSAAFNIPYYSCASYSDTQTQIDACLKISGPTICEVFLDENQSFSPKLGAKKMLDGSIISPRLEDMSPFLSREELKNNLL